MMFQFLILVAFMILTVVLIGAMHTMTITTMDYIMMYGLLAGILWFVLPPNVRVERFDAASESADTAAIPSFNASTSMQKLIRIPTYVQTTVGASLDRLINSVKGSSGEDNEVTFLDADSFKNESLQGDALKRRIRQYLMMDSVLNKLSVLDKAFYANMMKPFRGTSEE